ncbi:unnamed protein product, partial [marine sediment metagenome]
KKEFIKKKVSKKQIQSILGRGFKYIGIGIPYGQSGIVLKKEIKDKIMEDSKKLIREGESYLKQLLK